MSPSNADRIFASGTLAGLCVLLSLGGPQGVGKSHLAAIWERVIARDETVAT